MAIHESSHQTDCRDEKWLDFSFFVHALLLTVHKLENKDCSPVCRIADVSLVRHVSGYTCIKVTAAVAVGPWLFSGTCILWILLASTSGLFFLQHGQRFTQKYTHRHRYMLSKHSLNVLITPIHTDIFSDPVKKAHTCKKNNPKIKKEKGKKQKNLQHTKLIPMWKILL